MFSQRCLFFCHCQLQQLLQNKNFLRSQMSQDRLDGLSMLSIEAEKANQIDQSKVAITIARAKVRKVPMFV